MSEENTTESVQEAPQLHTYVLIDREPVGFTCRVGDQKISFKDNKYETTDPTIATILDKCIKEKIAFSSKMRKVDRAVSELIASQMHAAKSDQTASLGMLTSSFAQNQSTEVSDSVKKDAQKGSAFNFNLG